MCGQIVQVNQNRCETSRQKPKVNQRLVRKITFTTKLSFYAVITHSVYLNQNVKLNNKSSIDRWINGHTFTSVELSCGHLTKTFRYLLSIYTVLLLIKSNLPILCKVPCDATACGYLPSIRTFSSNTIKHDQEDHGGP